MNRFLALLLALPAARGHSCCTSLRVAGAEKYQRASMGAFDILTANGAEVTRGGRPVYVRTEGVCHTAGNCACGDTVQNQFLETASLSACNACGVGCLSDVCSWSVLNGKGSCESTAGFQRAGAQL